MLAMVLAKETEQALCLSIHPHIVINRLRSGTMFLCVGIILAAACENNFVYL